MLRLVLFSIIIFSSLVQATDFESKIPMKFKKISIDLNASKTLSTSTSTSTFRSASNSESSESSSHDSDYFYMPIGKQPNSGITYFQYFEILQYFSILYPQIYFPVEWVEPYFGAFAKFENKRKQVHVWGGLVRMQTATLPVVLTAICHEIGHHMGGQPFQDQVIGGEWASAEGQADYFAARYCLPRTYYDHPDWFNSLEKDFQQISTKQFDLQSCLKQQFCRVSLLSGYQMFQKFSELPSSMPEKIEFELNAKPTQKSILQTYPPLQCRFETFFSGGFCFVDSKSTKCQRPHCWYREAEKR